MSPELIRSAAFIARLMPADRDWWIIGSAALALGGIDVAPKDVDVFAAPDVIEAARRTLKVDPMPSASDRFRSVPYFQVRLDDALGIDFMGGLEVRSGDVWIGLQIKSRLALIVGNVTVFIPALAEQATILRLFARPKDLARAALVDA